MQELDFKTNENISLLEVNENTLFLVINKKYSDFLKVKENIINQVKNNNAEVYFTYNWKKIIWKIYFFSEKQNDKWLDFWEIIKNNFDENENFNNLKKIHFSHFERIITDLQLHDWDIFPNYSIAFEITLNK